MSGSILFHVQHLLGIGHLQRILRIADALARNNVDLTIASGGVPVALPRHPAIRFVQLPPVRARDARFALIDEAGAPLDEAMRERRRAAVLAAFAAARPDVVVIEGFPFARRAFRFEIDPLIEAARAARPRPLMVCSLRDIVVVRDDPERWREIVARVRGDFDTVLVHGDPSFIRLDASFPAAPEIADKLVYTGYVSPADEPQAEDAPSGADEVIVSAGGGAAGQTLLAAALVASCAGPLARLKWRLLAGSQIAELDFVGLCNAASANVTVERFLPDLPQMLRRCRVSVSQAGYNTVLDIVAARARAVLVPFEAGRETEQRLRAEQLAALGAAELVRESDLTPARLSAAIERAAARDPPTLAIDRDGAVRSAQLLAAMASGHPLANGLVAADARDIIAR